MSDFLTPMAPPPAQFTPAKLVNSLASLALRLGAGITLIVFHGWNEVRLGWNHVWKKEPWDMIRQLDSMGLPLAHILAPAVAFIGIVAIILLIPGILTRIVSAVLLVLTLPALIHTLHLPDARGHAEAGLLYSFCFTALIFLGSGWFSLDAAVKPRKPKPKKRPLA